MERSSNDDLSHRSKGGVRQRLADAKRQKLDMGKPSKLYMFLVRLWAWGTISPQLMQKIASRAEEDMEHYKITNGRFTEVFEDLSFLSCLGTNGANPGNMNRELNTRINVNDYAEAKQCTIPMKAYNAPETSWYNSQQSVFMPHDVFATLYHNNQSAFRKHILPDTRPLRAFWDSQANSPLLAGHPMLGVANWRNRAIPLAIHGDAASMVGVGKPWQKSMVLWSWCSILGLGLTSQCNYLVWGVYKLCASTVPTHDTIETLMQIFCWSLQILYSGRYPHRNWKGELLTNPMDVKRAGKPIAGTEDNFLFCVVYLLKGDLDYLFHDLKLNNYNRNTDPCCWCPCNATTMNYNEFRFAHATWMNHIYTKADWLASPYRLHPFFLLLTGVTILNVAVDIMHCKHLGVDAYFFASVLFLLCFDMLPGISLAAI